MKTISDKVRELSSRLEDIFTMETYAEADDLKDFGNILKNNTESARTEECQCDDNEICSNES